MGKIVTNRGRYSRRALSRPYSTFCGCSVLFMFRMYPLFEKKQLKSIQVMHFRCLKYLYYLPRSCRNHTIISVSFKRLNSVLADHPFYFAGLFPPANPIVLPLMVVSYLCRLNLFCFFFLSLCLISLFLVASSKLL